MARLAIDKDFLDDYSKLPKQVQSSVKTAIDKFAEHVMSPTWQLPISAATVGMVKSSLPIQPKTSLR